MSTEVLIVGGLGNKGHNLAPLRMLGELASARGRVHYIDGGELVRDTLTARSPSNQYEEMRRILERTKASEYLVLAQSIGTLAGLECIESTTTSRGYLVALAPPLPTPGHMLNHPRIKDRIKISNGIATIPSYSFALGDSCPSKIVPKPVDMVMQPNYFDEIYETSATFLARMESAAEQGRLRIVAPRNDWNVEGARIAATFPGTIVVDAEHSLHDDNEERLRSTCESIIEQIDMSFV